MDTDDLPLHPHSQTTTSPTHERQPPTYMMTTPPLTNDDCHTPPSPLTDNDNPAPMDNDPTHPQMTRPPTYRKRQPPTRGRYPSQREDDHPRHDATIIILLNL
ncbi:hypothetical protein K443DRAFT_13770 [Laccaria amethystina LaAM-08-1]|uniref:Unplaced genomic scaffold K443scaffold_392, whole genome shotgun sequence n=1 Tax=Laccaria amethystina LaAM-08-1 TaxID=1095629 RepID=A0A0C9X3E3_9AGAR|nr:hypothetical protein K443DRAFT_13770 [Laccaria amethystina LaAM-08-1]